MKLNKARPPLIFNGFSGVFVYNQNGDGQTKNTFGRGAYHTNTTKRKKYTFTEISPALIGDYKLTVRRS